MGDIMELGHLHSFFFQGLALPTLPFKYSFPYSIRCILRLAPPWRLHLASVPHSCLSNYVTLGYQIV